QAMAKGCSTLAEAESRLAEEVRKARMIGQVAVTFGGRQLRREVDARLRDARQAAEGVVSFIPGVNPPGGTNGAGTSGSGAPASPVVSATTTSATPASPAPTAAAQKPATKPSA